MRTLSMLDRTIAECTTIYILQSMDDDNLITGGSMWL